MLNSRIVKFDEISINNEDVLHDLQFPSNFSEIQIINDLGNYQINRGIWIEDISLDAYVVHSIIGKLLVTIVNHLLSLTSGIRDFRREHRFPHELKTLKEIITFIIALFNYYGNYFLELYKLFVIFFRMMYVRQSEVDYLIVRFHVNLSRKQVLSYEWSR